MLAELDIPYETVVMDLQDLKKDPYEKICVNGRVPAIEDPNNGGFILWESGAIIHYLIEEYDAAGKLSYKSGNEKYLVNQWLFFQASGQGPYVRSPPPYPIVRIDSLANGLYSTDNSFGFPNIIPRTYPLLWRDIRIRPSEWSMFSTST